MLVISKLYQDGLECWNANARQDPARLSADGDMATEPTGSFIIGS